MSVLIVIVLILVVLGIVGYNSLTKSKNLMENAELELKKYQESGSEKDLDNAKKYYTAVVREYNNKVETFPTSIIAGLFNFPKLHSDDFDEGL